MSHLEVSRDEVVQRIPKPCVSGTLDCGKHLPFLVLRKVRLCFSTFVLSVAGGALVFAPVCTVSTQASGPDPAPFAGLLQQSTRLWKLCDQITALFGRSAVQSPTAPPTPPLTPTATPIPPPDSNLTVNGTQTFQTMDGFGVNINSLSWKNGESKPAIDLLADQMGATTWRVVFDEEDWENPNDNADPHVFDWNYYHALYSNAKFQNLWGTLGYLNQKGFTKSIAVSFMGIPPSWMGTGGHINPSAEDEWVEMMASVVSYARNTAHVQFGMLAPINEPGWDGIEGPLTDAVQTTRLLHNLAVKLDSLGLSDVRLLGPETAGGFNTAYVSQMMSDSTVMNKVDRSIYQHL